MSLPTKRRSSQLISRLRSRVQALRRAAGWTQGTLSEHSGISLRHIQDIEAGRIDVRLSMLNKLSTALHVDPIQLICPEACASLDSHPKTAHEYGEGFDKLLVATYSPLDELPIGIQFCNTSGLIQYVNSYWARTQGFSSSEVIGKFYIWDLLLSEKEKEDLKKYLKFLVTNKPDPRPYISKNKTKDGRTLPVRIHWNYLMDSDSNVLGFFSQIYIESR